MDYTLLLPREILAIVRQYCSFSEREKWCILNKTHYALTLYGVNEKERRLALQKVYEEHQPTVFIHQWYTGYDAKYFKAFYWHYSEHRLECCTSDERYCVGDLGLTTIPLDQYCLFALCCLERTLQLYPFSASKSIKVRIKLSPWSTACIVDFNFPKAIDFVRKNPLPFMIHRVSTLYWSLYDLNVEANRAPILLSNTSVLSTHTIQSQYECFKGDFTFIMDSTLRYSTRYYIAPIDYENTVYQFTVKENFIFAQCNHPFVSNTVALLENDHVQLFGHALCFLAHIVENNQNIPIDSSLECRVSLLYNHSAQGIQSFLCTLGTYSFFTTLSTLLHKSTANNFQQGCLQRLHCASKISKLINTT